jgi:hypothetical protein
LSSSDEEGGDDFPHREDGDTISGDAYVPLCSEGADKFFAASPMFTCSNGSSVVPAAADAAAAAATVAAAAAATAAAGAAAAAAGAVSFQGGPHIRWQLPQINPDRIPIYFDMADDVDCGSPTPGDFNEDLFTAGTDASRTAKDADQDRPRMRKRPWTMEEDAALLHLGVQVGSNENITWKNIADAVGAGRTTSSVRHRWLWMLKKYQRGEYSDQASTPFAAAGDAFVLENLSKEAAKAVLDYSGDPTADSNAMLDTASKAATAADTAAAIAVTCANENYEEAMVFFQSLKDAKVTIQAGEKGINSSDPTQGDSSAAHTESVFDVLTESTKNETVEGVGGATESADADAAEVEAGVQDLAQAVDGVLASEAVVEPVCILPNS